MSLSFGMDGRSGARQAALALRAAQQPARDPDWALPLLAELEPGEHIGPDSELNGQEPIVRLFGGAAETSVPIPQEVNTE